MSRPYATGEPLDVPFTTAEFLALAGRTFADLNESFWRIKNALPEQPTGAQLEHVEELRARRKAAYSDLMAWAFQSEAERVGARPPLNHVDMGVRP